MNLESGTTRMPEHTPNNLAEEDINILIVDDDPLNLELMSKLILRFGYTCATAENGRSAIERLEDEVFSIVITDMMMPELDGMELLRHVNANFPETDVIVVTGFSKDYKYIEMINAGAADFIEKPITPDELAAKLSRITYERSLINKLRKEIAARKKTEKELWLAKSAAEQASQAKTAFISTISHELRTPLNGILGMQNLLSKTPLNEEQRHYLDLMTVSSKRFSNLINQILNFSTIPAHPGVIPDVRFRLRQVLDEAVQLHKAAADEKDIQIILSVPDRISDIFKGGIKALQGILNNLIDNAIKFSDQGQVTIEVKSEERIDPKNVQLHFIIHDTGPGIPQNKQEIIFDLFTQAEGWQTRKHEGAGLGLAICANLIPMLRGEIWIESVENKGSSFHFTAVFKPSPVADNDNTGAISPS